MIYPKKTIEVTNNKNEAVVDATADALKKEKKEVITGSSLDVLENQVDTTLTGEDAKKGLENLGTEINIERVNKKLEAKEKVSSIATQVDYFLSQKDKSIDGLSDDQGKLAIESFNAYVGNNLLGSFYSAILHKCEKSDGTYDVSKFQNYITQYSVSTVDGLLDALKKSEAVLDAQEQKVVNFLQGGSPLAKDYASKEYTGVASLMAKNMPTILANANIYFAAHPVTGKTFADKMKNLGNKIADDFKKHPVRDTILVVGGGFLLYKGIKRLFGKKKKKSKDNESDEKDSDSKEGNHKLLKKILLTLGIGGAAWFLWNWYTKGKFGGTNPGHTPDQADIDAFMKLDPEIVKKYTAMAEEVNNMYMLTHGDQNAEGIANDDDMFGESSYEKDGNVALKGVVPYVLSERYADMSHFLDEKALFTEIINGDIQAMISKARIWAGDKAQAIFGPILSKIEGFTSFLGANRDTDKAFDFIKGNVNAQEAIRSMFRKVIKMMAYFKNREDALQAFYIKEYLTTKNTDGFIAKSEKEQNEMVEKYSKDTEFCKKNITPLMKKGFYDVTILQAFVTLQEKGLAGAELDEDQKEALQQLQKMKQKYADALKPLEGLNSFDVEQKEQVKDICDDVIDEMQHTGKRTYTQRFFSFITSFTNSDENAMQQMMDGMDYDELIKPYKEKILAIQKKCDDGTLLASDIEDLHKILDDYAVFQNDLINGAQKIQEIKNENGNVGARIMYGFKIMGHDVSVAVETFCEGWKDGDVLKMVKAGVVVYPTGVTIASTLKIVSSALHGDIKGMRAGVKIFGKGMSLPLKPVVGLSKLVLKRNIGLVPSWTMSKEGLLRLYGVKNVDELAKVLRLDFISGRISQSKLINILQRYPVAGELNGIDDASKLYKYIFGRDFAKAEVQALEKYLANDVIRQQLCTKKVNRGINRRYGTKKRLATSLKIEQESLEALMNIDKSIQTLVGGDVAYAKNVAQSLLKNTNNLGSATSMIEKIVANPQIISSTKGIISAEKYGAMLGRHASKIGETGMIEITSFIQKAGSAKKILNAESFVLNSLRNFEAIKAAGFNMESKAVQELALNESKFSRIINTVGEWTKDAGKGLVRLKNALIKSPNGLSQARTQTEKVLAEIDASKLPASCKKQVLEQATEARKIMQEAQPVAQQLEKTLSGASEKALLEQTQVAANLEAKQLSLLSKIKSNKLLMKVIRFSPAILEVVTGIIGFSDAGKEVDEVKKYNLERGEVKDTHRYFNLAISGAGATLMAVGIANGWNPVGWGIMAVAAGIEGVKYLGNKYYEVVESYYQNIVDFKREYLGTIKQELMSKSASGLNIDVSIKERFQENTALIGSVFGNTFTRGKKLEQATITLESATRAIVYMEEMERFPLADMDKNLIDTTTDEGKQLSEQIDAQKKAIDAAVNARFDYIVKQRPSLKDIKKPSILSEEELKKGRALDQIDALLVASRKFVRLEGKSIDDFEKNELAALTANQHDFAKFETLWKTNKRDVQCAAFWLETYESLIDSQQATIPEYTMLKEKIAYFKKYYNYKTYGLLQSDMPLTPEDINNMPIDTNMVEHLFKDGEVVPSTMTREEMQQSIISGKTILDTPLVVAQSLEVSGVLGQQVFYRIAKETMGYKGKNDLQELKTFYTESKDDTLGIYHLENSWYFNVDGMSDFKICDDNQLNDEKTLEKFLAYLAFNKKSHSNIVTKTHSGDTYINNEFTEKREHIVQEELTMRKPEKKNEIKNNIQKFIQERSKGEYIALPAELAAEAIRSGYADVGSCQYVFEGGQVKAIAPKMFESHFPGGKNSLGYVIEFIDAPAQTPDKDLQLSISVVDKMHTDLTAIVFEKNTDFAFNDAIISFVKQKSEEWQALRKQLLVSGKNNERLVEKMTSYQHTFENTYTTILAIATKGNNNDVDKTSHFELINQLQSANLVTLSGEMTSVTCHCEALDIASEYTKKLQALCNSSDYKVPGTMKSVFDLYRDTTTPHAKELATRAANVLLTCILESAMFGYDANGNIDEIYGWGRRGINTSVLQKQIAKKYTVENMHI